MATISCYQTKVSCRYQLWYAGVDFFGHLATSMVVGRTSMVVAWRQQVAIKQKCLVDSNFVMQGVVFFGRLATSMVVGSLRYVVITKKARVDSNFVL